jgi:acyl-CoA thioester hydrolase
MDFCDVEVRVRYAETDQMGMAHHTSYLVWFEAGRTEFIRSRGRSYAQVEQGGWWLVVVEAYCRYRRPARYDDVLIVRTHLRDLGPATLSFGYQVLRSADGAVLADGHTVHAAVDRTGRPRRIPDDLRRLLAAPKAVAQPRAGRQRQPFRGPAPAAPGQERPSFRRSTKVPAAGGPRVRARGVRE